MRITATRDTYLKKSTANADTLPDTKKVFVPKGKEYAIAQHLNTDGNHEHVKLAHAAGSWFVFRDHWHMNLDKGEVLLPVPYLSQRDNTIRPSQTCNMTSAAMVVGYYYPDKLKGKRQLEDVLTEKLTQAKGPSSIYYHANIVAILKEYGVNSTFSTETSFAAIKAHLATGNPVIYSGRFTSSGHIIVLVGFDDKGFIVNDPWGEWFSTGYQKKPGQNLHYSYAMMKRLAYGDDGGWAHLCTKAGTTPPSKPPDDTGLNLDLIKRWEGLRLKAYHCPAGVPTIGYGTTEYPNGKKVKMGDRITKQQAEEYLEDFVVNAILPKLSRIPHWDEMNVNQRSALVSFAYNLGASFYDASGFTTITSALKNKHWDKVPSALRLYVKAGGKTLEGLVNRRASEAKLWSSNITRVNGETTRISDGKQLTSE